MRRYLLSQRHWLAKVLFFVGNTPTLFANIFRLADQQLKFFNIDIALTTS